MRTEFLVVGRATMPDEDEQYRAYRRVVEAFRGRPVIIRTFDIGGDKLPVGGFPAEPNPFLGWRAIRMCLDEPAALPRAAARAAARRGARRRAHHAAARGHAWTRCARRARCSRTPPRSSPRAACRIRDRRAARRHDRDAGRRHRRRHCSCGEVEFFSIGTQRPGAVHARRGSRQREPRRRASRRCTRPCCGSIREVARRGASSAACSVGGVRRDGVAAAHGVRAARARRAAAERRAAQPCRS